ncbi:MAG: WYL domain-containing protein [Bacteroidaceae bacterium]|nr:WYL domain-containing protein [Bacteroidaceae bacterium]
MATQTLRKYVWLINTIHKHPGISFKDINDKWQYSDLSEGNELPLRTFHKWRNAIYKVLGLRIAWRDGDGYFIANDDDIKEGTIRKWLMDNISVSNILMSNLALKDRILLEDVPSSKDHLNTILEAMQTNTVLSFTYQGFGRKNAHTFDLHPYCVKLFKQRWYMLGFSPSDNRLRIYALDRVDKIELKNGQTFCMPRNFNAEDYFMNFYGIVANSDKEPEQILIKVSAEQAKYIKTLRLHWSQDIMEDNDEYTIFKYKLCPEYDFMQELLSHGADLEVLSPEWLREEIAEKVTGMYNLYY